MMTGTIDRSSLDQAAAVWRAHTIAYFQHRMQKAKRLNLLLILTSLMGYLEWGGGNHAFLFDAEAEVISKLFTDPASVIHAFTLIPLAGQILLLITLFQKFPNRILTFIGMGAIAVLLLFMFIAGLLALKAKVILSVLPFLVMAVVTIRYRRRHERVSASHAIRK